jgi:hypothetical protein
VRFHDHGCYIGNDEQINKFIKNNWRFQRRLFFRKIDKNTDHYTSYSDNNHKCYKRRRHSL